MKKSIVSHSSSMRVHGIGITPPKIQKNPKKCAIYYIGMNSIAKNRKHRIWWDGIKILILHCGFHYLIIEKLWCRDITFSYVWTLCCYTFHIILFMALYNYLIIEQLWWTNILFSYFWTLCCYPFHIRLFIAL